MTPARDACRVLALAAVVLGVRGAASAQFGGFQAGLRTFTPGAPVQVQIRTSSPTDLAVDVIPVPVADVLAIRRSNDLVRLDELHAKPVRTVRDGIHPDLERGLLHDVRIGTLPRGYYVLAIHAGTGASAHARRRHVARRARDAHAARQRSCSRSICKRCTRAPT